MYQKVLVIFILSAATTIVLKIYLIDIEKDYGLPHISIVVVIIYSVNFWGDIDYILLVEIFLFWSW